MNNDEKKDIAVATAKAVVLAMKEENNKNGVMTPDQCNAKHEDLMEGISDQMTSFGAQVESVGQKVHDLTVNGIRQEGVEEGMEMAETSQTKAKTLTYHKWSAIGRWVTIIISILAGLLTLAYIGGRLAENFKVDEDKLVMKVVEAINHNSKDY